MAALDFEPLTAELRKISAVTDIGRVRGISNNALLVAGLTHKAVLGDQVLVKTRTGTGLRGEVLRLETGMVTVLPDGPAEGVAIGDAVELRPPQNFCPDESWIGRIISPGGRPLDGRFLSRGCKDYPLQNKPPAATSRRALGARLQTGLRLFNTLLPLARGQRIGLFAGSGIGKSTLIGQLAQRVNTDVTVIALVGERGRELREFVENVLGRKGMARAVVVAATSDESPLNKRRAALAAMSVAEYFRDRGKQVLLVVDSITRFAEAHREIALAAGEAASMRGFPPSITQMIMSLCERAGPGVGSAGDITALFSVLVAGSDMDEPIADTIRGVLDGHVVLERKIAERGRFPAVDVLRSVSRCLPGVASGDENTTIAEVRRLLGAYDSAELMIRAGLYEVGSDEMTDRAIGVWRELEEFFTQEETSSISDSFAALSAALKAGETGHAT
jgi:flagellum-specific ATP synthase